MKKNSSLLFIFCLLISCNPTEPKRDYTQYVKPNIGTAHSRWFFYTPAAKPFGMAKVAPSTNGSYGNPGGWEVVGYDERHTSIEGFPNFHEFQVGGITFAPSVGRLQTVPGKLEDTESGYRSNFDKKDEFATAGYYSVLLKDYNIRAELTATDRVGFHRYTFPESKKSNIIFDIGRQMGESGQVIDAGVKIIDDRHIEGYVITRPEYVKKYQAGATVSMYFSAELDKAPESSGTFVYDSIVTGQKEMKGIGAGAYMTFNTKANEAVTIKAGLSYTSIENARRNLMAEAADLGFDKAKEQAMATWNDYLGRIDVEGGTMEDKT